jgi:hypothetical protein
MTTITAHAWLSGKPPEGGHVCPGVGEATRIEVRTMPLATLAFATSTAAAQSSAASGPQSTCDRIGDGIGDGVTEQP